MKTKADQLAGQEAKRSVWLLAIGGSAIGSVVFLVIALVLMDLRARRVSWVEITSISDSALGVVSDETVNSRNLVMAMLADSRSKSRKVIDDREGLGAVRDASGQLAEAGLADSADTLNTMADQMLEIEQVASRWREAQDLALAQRELSAESIRDALSVLQERVAHVKGQQRLKLAIELRRSRRDEELSQVGIKQLFDQLTKHSELSSISTDLAKLETVLERVFVETQADILADTRDNVLKPFIDRLTGPCEALGASDAWRQLLTGVLGDGYQIDNLHQTIRPGEGGLMRLTSRLLELKEQREALRARATDAYDRWRQNLSDLHHSSEELLSQTTSQTERALTKAWVSLALLGVFSNLLFFFFAYRIAGTINSQIGEIDQVSRDLAQAQKLEAVGQLAAGIAHEINSPLQYVFTNVEYLTSCSEELFSFLETYEELLDSGGEALSWGDRVGFIKKLKDRNKYDRIIKDIPDAIADSQEGLNRVLEIVRAMKTFSHPGNEAFVATDLNEAITDAATITRHRWKACAELTTDLDKDLPYARALPAEINQVLLNLLVNAADAIAEKGNEDEVGKITIRSRADDEHIIITVSDTGAGIPDEVRDKIFDPFFTTKEVGKGTGQGLAICFDVVVIKHNGSLRVESKPGEGTTFEVRLPINQEGGADEAPAPDSKESEDYAFA